MEEFEIDIVETKCHTNGAKIKAIGVGGGGGNMINHMISEGINSIDLIVANTDAQALDSSLAPYKMQLGINATRGLGAGMLPDKGREAALESFEDIKKMLEGSDIVFISAGLGGGTGTGAAPIIAQAAKEVGALTVSIVTSPFKFEGRKRTKLAKEGLEELKRESDSIIVVPNEKLLSIVEKNLGIKESFRMVDDILAQAVGGISKVILSHGENDITEVLLLWVQDTVQEPMQPMMQQKLLSSLHYLTISLSMVLWVYLYTLTSTLIILSWRSVKR